MKRLVIFISILSCAMAVQAQDYDKAIGLRLGYGSGITFKKALSSESMVEILAETRWYGVNLTALFELNKYNVFDTEGATFYYGGGAHIGSYRSRDDWDRNQSVFIGVDGIIGLEYVINEYPVVISLDWKPAFNIIGHDSFYGDNGALSARYIF